MRQVQDPDLVSVLELIGVLICEIFSKKSSLKDLILASFVFFVEFLDSNDNWELLISSLRIDDDNWSSLKELLIPNSRKIW